MIMNVPHHLYNFVSTLRITFRIFSCNAFFGLQDCSYFGVLVEFFGGIDKENFLFLMFSRLRDTVNITFELLDSFANLRESR